MKILAEYSLVALGTMCFCAAVFNFGWWFTEEYPRSAPTLWSIPASLIGMWQCFSLAADISISRLS